MYFYRLRMGGHEQTGLAACYSIDEYGRDIVKKHEKTRRDKEDDRTRHIIALRAQTGPVFLTYRHNRRHRRPCRAGLRGPATLPGPAPDGIVHTVWRPTRRPRPNWRRRSARSTRCTSPTATTVPPAARGLMPISAGAQTRSTPGAWASRFRTTRPRSCVSPGGQGPRRPDAPRVSRRGRHARRGRAGRALGEAQGRMPDVPEWAMVCAGAPAGGFGGQRRPDQVARRVAAPGSAARPVLGIKDLRTDKRIDFVGGIRARRARAAGGQRGRRGCILDVPP